MSRKRLIDVARAAGVSKSTVSQFLNGRFDYMSKATRARIETAIDELDYVPNPIARSLKTDTTRTVGVIVRDIAGFYTSHALRGMDDHCKRHGYNLFIYNTDFDPAAEARAMKSLNQLRVDGMIIASSGSNQDLLTEIASRKMPIVQFQLEHDDSAKNIILSDYRRAAFEATEYLIGLGHRRICFVTQSFRHVKSRLERYQGYVDALTKHGIPVDERQVRYWQRDRGLDFSPRQVLESDEPPTAFFAQHLAVTTDLLRTLHEQDVRVPDDVSVIGFDEIPMAEFFRVPVTVIRQRPYDIGASAAKLLLQHIHAPDTEVQRVLVPCTLVKRDSCRELPEVSQG